jgi:hypothetical protein
MSNFSGPITVIPNPLGSPSGGNDMSGNITSSPYILNDLAGCSFSFSWVGSSPVGTISIQGSNDYSIPGINGRITNAGTWNTLTLNYNGSAVTTVPVTGNTGNGMVDITITGIYAVRAVYTAGSGTGNLIATLFCKVV